MNFDRLTLKAQGVVNQARQLVLERSHQQLEPEHLLTALLEDKQGIVILVLKQAEVDLDTIFRQMNTILNRYPKVYGTNGQIYESPEFHQTFNNSLLEAKALNDEYISAEHLFLGILSTKECKAAKILLENGLAKEYILKQIKEVRGNYQITDPNPEVKYMVLNHYTRDLTYLASQEKLDPVVDRDNEIQRVLQVICRRNKNNPVLIGDPGVGKTAIVEGIAQRIIDGDAPEILDETKIIALDLSAIVEGTKSRNDFEESLKSILKDFRESKGQLILFIDEIHMLLGTGTNESILDASNILKPILSRGEILCIGATTIDEYRKYIQKDLSLERRFHPIIVEEPSAEATISMLKGIKERYENHHGVTITDGALIAAAHFSRRYITDRRLPDKAIDLIDEAAAKLRIESKVMPDDLEGVEQQIKILETELETLKKENKLSSRRRLINLEKELIKLQDEYNNLNAHRQLEKQTIQEIETQKASLEQLYDKMKEAEQTGNLEWVAEIKYGLIPERETQILSLTEKLQLIQQENEAPKEEVNKKRIAEVVSDWTGIPVNRIIESEREKFLKIEERLAKQVIGQDNAVIAISNAVRRSRAGLADQKRPIGSFIFLGPSGVGKTELARALAEFLFDDENAMIRLDMSEYMERHAVSKLIGAPPDCSSHDNGGQLTEAVRRKPYAVILLDEIEKANPEVLNLLLQVIEDGQLADSKGKTVHFKNTIVIMTSNIGSHLILEKSRKMTQQNSELVSQDIEQKMLVLLRQQFRPEFMNRIDETIVFHCLSRNHIKKIIDLQLRHLQQQLSGQGIRIILSEPTKEYLANEGYEPAFGARPLRRVIQRQIIDPLSKEILAERIYQGQVVKVNYNNQQIGFETFDTEKLQNGQYRLTRKRVLQ